MEARLSSAQFRVITATNVTEALEVLQHHPVDLLISDMRMPGLSGMDLLKEVRDDYPDLPVVFLTAYGTIPDAVKAVKAGAVEYLTKPFNGRDLLQRVQKILKDAPVHAATGPPALSPKTDIPDLKSGVWGVRSSSMRELYELLERVAPSNVNVLILGESGVGKERIARLIHQSGPRRDHPLVVVDCGSTPTGLLESELFGHVRGAFTHAIRDKKGLIEAAHGGTLFLDEIGNISPEMQIRLLRFLEDRRIRRIGDLREIPVDCRVIAATNVDLPGDVKAGRFRQDLYYRLRVVTLRIPSLRERTDDIPSLAQHFVETFCQSQGLPMTRILPETVDWLCQYEWPGNVRELKNALEASVVLCKDGIIHARDLQLAGLPATPLASPGTAASSSLSLEDSERNAIVRALEQAGWVQKDAAELLGISRRAINYKIKKYGIDTGSRRSAEG
ncbi:MAG TPA: sigma-54-dependent Fis family transcriptional regulator [Syntrophobacteraceae bacterium]|nr:sigma-54-dependent Fis family transcriptional regulator [Syntrophobacteraceae bacterium]